MSEFALPLEGTTNRGYLSLCVDLGVNACTCAWRAWKRQHFPKGGIYLKRPSHDPAWSLSFRLLRGLRICVCTVSSECVCVGWRLRICSSLLSAHSTNLTDSLVQLSAKKQPTSKVQIPAEDSYLPLYDRGESTLPKGNGELPISLYACKSFSLLFASATIHTSTFIDSAWCWQFDRLSHEEFTVIGNGMKLSFFKSFCKHFKQAPSILCSWYLFVYVDLQPSP